MDGRSLVNHYMEQNNYRPEIVGVFVRYGASTSWRDADDQTILSRAIAAGNQELLHYLTQRADTHIADA